MARAREHAAGVKDIVSAVGAPIVGLESSIDAWAEDDVRLMSFTVSTYHKTGGDYLVVARFEAGGEKFVAFHSADTVWEALKGFANRMRNKDLKLKEDEYA